MQQLNFKKSVTTRQGDKIKIYEVYEDYLHGAWFNETADMWTVATWTLPNGFHLHKKHLDLVNGDPHYWE